MFFKYKYYFNVLKINNILWLKNYIQKFKVDLIKKLYRIQKFKVGLMVFC